jgi:chromosome segregation ATPase
MKDRTSSNLVLPEALREQVAMLQAELEDWKGVVSTRDEELRRKDHIIAALTERIPELEPPYKKSPEPRDATEKASEDTDRASVAQEPQEPAGRRSWLYRFFFGP